MSDTIAINAIKLHKRHGIVTVSIAVDGHWYDVLAAGLYGEFEAGVGAEDMQEVVEGKETGLG